MLLKYFYDETLAQASYLIGCARTGEALVVDPMRDVEPYLAAAAKEGLRITHVTETHIHADFVSGVRELAARIPEGADLGNVLTTLRFIGIDDIPGYLPAAALGEGLTPLADRDRR
jgi:glyoxylase-like metal-dependent hydrolase (beta-lactamase superfamily II)